MSDNSDNSTGNVSRRSLLGSAAATAAVAGAAAFGMKRPLLAEPKEKGEGRVIKNGNIKQSIVHWCFSKFWNVEETAKIAKKLGCGSIELVSPEHFPTLKKHGLECAIGTIDMGDLPPFVRGFNNPKYFDQVTKATKDAIDACAEFGYERVICFTGMSEDISDEEGADNCVKGLKEIVGYAEKKKITLCLEMLNTRDDTHPMKGHPGYQGDDTEYCIDIIKRVGSENLKLLFDIYHVQIMNGDVVRRIHEHKDYLGHIHTAGNPGRGELHLDQEINYPAVMKALVDIKYDGFVGQEFIPVEDPMVGLKKAVALCDV